VHTFFACAVFVYLVVYWNFSMADESSELEVLEQMGLLNDEDSTSSESEAPRRTQNRATYRHERTFEDADAFDEWWYSEGSHGWEQKDTYTSKKNGNETVSYR
jgi:hypothetical protein